MSHGSGTRMKVFMTCNPPVVGLVCENESEAGRQTLTRLKIRPKMR